MTRRLMFLVAILAMAAIALPPAVGARESAADPTETPEASESPDASETPEPSETPKLSETPKASVTPRASGTVRPTKTPEREREEERENEDAAKPELEAEETPEILVPADLQADAADIASNDTDVLKIKVDDQDGQKRVEVKYRLRAKLFGVIDVPYELNARVETNGGETKVEAKGPWWLLFARDNSDEVQTALEADPTLTTATNQGTVLSTLIGILKSLAR